MSSTLPAVVYSFTDVDKFLPLVEPLGLGSSSNSSSLNNNNIMNNSSDSIISSGPRALGGYSISLLCNSNLAQPAVDDTPQASHLPGAKRLRPYSLPPSIPRSRITSSDNSISASSSLATDSIVASLH